MRFEEISLPLPGGHFQLRFHARVTVLAGLTPTQRADILDAFAAASTGRVEGGTIVYRDRGGRRIVVREGAATYLDDGSPAPLPLAANAEELRDQLLLQPGDLGLPAPLSPADRLRLEHNHADTELALAEARTTLDAARTQHQRRRTLLGELEALAAEIAAAGGDSSGDHGYHAALAELERVRATLDAVDASPSDRDQDDRLLRAAVDAHALADEWSQAADRLDELTVLFNDRKPLPAHRLTTLRRVPEQPPAGLEQTLAEVEEWRVRTEHAAAQLESTELLGGEAPEDVRVVALATIDPETLWFAHRRVLLASEQLEQARLAAASLGSVDPEILARAEQAAAVAADARAVVERKSPTGMLVVSLLVCMSLLTALAGIARVVAVPAFLAVALIVAVQLLLKPRLAARRADSAARTAVTDAGAESLIQLRQRFLDDAPDSLAWRRADEVVEEYEAANEAWFDLVGNLSVAEVGELEDEVNRFVAASDPRQRAQRIERMRTNLTRAEGELARVERRLADQLAPFDLVPEDVTHGAASAVHDRIRDGYTARVQLDIASAEAREREIAARLEGMLAMLGFRSGTLEARVGALGWAIDEARQRQARRGTAPSTSELTAERNRLEQVIRHLHEPVGAENPSPDEARLQSLRTRQATCRAELAQVAEPDLPNLRLAHDRLSLRLAALANALSDEAMPLEDDTEERLVATLTNLRPSWFDASEDPMPAILDEPFAAVPEDRRGRLLNLMVTASETTQVVLLTSDPRIALWARAQAARNIVTLLEPTQQAEPATLDA